MYYLKEGMRPVAQAKPIRRPAELFLYIYLYTNKHLYCLKGGMRTVTQAKSVCCPAKRVAETLSLSLSIYISIYIHTYVYSNICIYIYIRIYTRIYNILFERGHTHRRSSQTRLPFRQTNRRNSHLPQTHRPARPGGAGPPHPGDPPPPHPGELNPLRGLGSQGGLPARVLERTVEQHGWGGLEASYGLGRGCLYLYIVYIYIYIYIYLSLSISHALPSIISLFISHSLSISLYISICINMYAYRVNPRGSWHDRVRGG